jgi:hypothetical protein
VQARSEDGGAFFETPTSTGTCLGAFNRAPSLGLFTSNGAFVVAVAIAWQAMYTGFNSSHSRAKFIAAAV